METGQRRWGRLPAQGSTYRTQPAGAPLLAALLLPVGWLLAAAGYYGPWVAHPTSALTLSGPDLGEFVKFLPPVQSGSLVLVRQFFYLPAAAVAAGVALLVGCRRLRWPWPVRAALLALAVPVSLQLLPPAWSPASLRLPEFRVQAIALAGCWLLLATCWLWGRISPRITGPAAAVLALAAAALSGWQFLAVQPAVDEVYLRPTAIGWGFWLCQAGLVLVVLGGLFLLAARRRSRALGSYV